MSKSASAEAQSKAQDVKEKEKEMESSGDDDDGFTFKKLLKKEEIKLNDEFRSEIENSVKYLGALKGLTNALEKMCISGTSFHFDQKREVPYSGWRYLTGYLKKVEFTGKANKAEAAGLIDVCNELGYTEEKLFAQVRNPDERANIYLAVGDQREKMDELSKAIAISVKTCNRRRKKVEKSLLLRDLKDQCPKYKAAVLQLDDECRDMENYKTNLRANRPHHHQHMKRSLNVVLELTMKKNKILKEAAIKQAKRATGKEKEEKKQDASSQKSFMKRLAAKKK